MVTAECLAELADRRTDEVVVAAMSSAVHWPALSEHPRDLIYVPSTMGGAPALGLGIALARPDLRVVVLNGDGCMLMSLGSLVTIGEQAPENLVVVVFDNGIYAVTGGQATPGAGKVDFAAMARAANWKAVGAFSNLTAWTEAIPRILSEPGPTFVHLKVEPEPTAISGPRVPMAGRLAALRKAIDRRG
jgi:sulfopyruvate decarboxylase subunit beta